KVFVFIKIIILIVYPSFYIKNNQSNDLYHYSILKLILVQPKKNQLISIKIQKQEEIIQEEQKKHLNRLQIIKKCIPKLKKKKVFLQQKNNYLYVNKQILQGNINRQIQ
ncbi:hypothetical protein IMG5_083560, partial [Ichthyophthirius multifiliis]